MQMAEVREKAKKLGLKTSRKGKRDLIREIQAAEGNYQCYGTAVDSCDQLQCCWREDCLPGKSA